MILQELAELATLLERSTLPVTPEEARFRRAAYWQSTIKIETVEYEDRLQTKSWIGSGVLLSPAGYFITNYHVLDHRALRRTVLLPSETATGAPHRLQFDRCLCKHASYDLMLARCVVPPDLQQHLRKAWQQPRFAKTGAELHDEVRTFGYKHETVEERVGKILGKEGAIRLTGDGRIVGGGWGNPNLYTKKDVAWYTDAEIEEGFSGGPVVRACTGELLGVTWASAGDTQRLDHSYIATAGIEHVLRVYLTKTCERPIGKAQPSRTPERKGFFQSMLERVLG